MKQILAIIFVVVPIVGSVCLGQDTRPTSQVSSSPNSAQPQQTPGGDRQTDEAGTIPLQLTKSLDARKLKAGDPVEAKVAADLRIGDGTVVPHGSKVLGHVTKASARAKGDSDSELGIAFDQIVLKDGKQVPLKASIQAVGPPPSYGPEPTQMGGGAPIPNTGAPGPIGGANPAGLGPPQPNFPSNPSAGTAPPPSQGDQQNSAQITPQSTGVVGLHDLQLEQGSILASSGKDVKLEAGSQLLLRVQNQ
jgi:hypothetical protein